MECVGCGSAEVAERPDRTAQGYRRFQCCACGRGFNERSAGVLNRTQYPSDVIALGNRQRIPTGYSSALRFHGSRSSTLLARWPFASRSRTVVI